MKLGISRLQVGFGEQREKRASPALPSQETVKKRGGEVQVETGGLLEDHTCEGEKDSGSPEMIISTCSSLQGHTKRPWVTREDKNLHYVPTM